MMAAQFRQRLAHVERRTTAQPVVVPDAVQLLQAAGIAPDPWQRAVLQSQAPRILLNCCRQSGKTVTAAALALHAALAEAGALVLILSPSLRQSQESFRAVADLARASGAHVPLEAMSALRLELTNRARVVSLPGTETTVRGYSKVRVLVIDEAARVADALYYSITPMLAVSGGRVVALSTTWGKRGWWHRAYTEEPGWERVTITAYECSRISASFLDQERRTLPDLWFRSEYLCEFTDTITSVFREADIAEALAQDAQPWFPGGF